MPMACAPTPRDTNVSANEKAGNGGVQLTRYTQIDMPASASGYGTVPESEARIESNHPAVDATVRITVGQATALHADTVRWWAGRGQRAECERCREQTGTRAARGTDVLAGASSSSADGLIGGSAS